MRLRHDTTFVMNADDSGFSRPSVIQWAPPGSTDPVALIFPETADLADRCDAVADQWGDAAALDFVSTVYPQHLLWAACEDCGTDAPFDKHRWQRDGYAHCLICSTVRVTVEEPQPRTRHLRLV